MQRSWEGIPVCHGAEVQSLTPLPMLCSRLCTPLVPLQIFRHQALAVAYRLHAA
jgi:hypothetical protein